jgi:hypothetical protein
MAISRVTFLIKGFVKINHRSAIVMGVVRHAVNKSAGKSGDIGNISFGLQAAS